MTTIGTNIGSLNASYYLTLNNEALNRSLKKMSAGSRLADPTADAAGVAVSGKLDANIRKLAAAVDGAQNVISFAQTTDGFLSTIQQQVTRMAELAQRATNGSFGSSDRANYATEFNILKTQINSIISNATYNGISVFANTSISTAINSDGLMDSLQLKQLNLNISSVSIDTVTNAQSAIFSMNSALTSITNRRAEVNADISKFNFNIQNIKTEKINVESANSRIKDLDIAEESMILAKNNILLQAATSMLAQANAAQMSVLSLLR